MLHSGIGESLQYNNERDKRDGRLENLLVWQPSSTAHIYFFFESCTAHIDAPCCVCKPSRGKLASFAEYCCTGSSSSRTA
jgi:hypothetical protein